MRRDEKKRVHPMGVIKAAPHRGDKSRKNTSSYRTIQVPVPVQFPRVLVQHEIRMAIFHAILCLEGSLVYFLGK